MKTLRKLKIVSGTVGKGEQIFDRLIKDCSGSTNSLPSEYVQKMWTRYESYPDRSNSLNGIIFEYILASLLLRENITPLYLQAKIAFVPNVNFDIMTYTKEIGPICLSVKTSLRERYKQADLEAIVLKNVHRRALCYLITLEEKEAPSVRNKIKTGDVIGLDNVILATSTDFDDLVEELKGYQLEHPQPIKIISASRLII